jgi:hypothetical protein
MNYCAIEEGKRRKEGNLVPWSSVLEKLIVAQIHK